MINREQIRAYVATPKGKLVVACSCLGLCWLFLLLYFFGDAIAAFGDPKSLEKAKRELAAQKAAYGKIRGGYDELQAQKKRYRALLDAACRESGEDRVKTQLHNSITAAASKLEFKLSRISSISIGRLNGELYYADVDIAADGKLDEIIALISALEEITPKPIWKQLVLRPDNRPRPQASSGIDSLNLANQMMNIERTRVTMSGTLRVICVDESAPTATPRAPRK